MLFNSNVFLFLFLPIALAGFFAFGRVRAAWAIGWLVGASLFFYAWWNPRLLGLLVVSIGVNYALGRAAQESSSRSRARGYAAVGVVLDLAAIGWFKYANFLGDTAHQIAGIELELPAIALPLAISFYTFQQIAYLVDSSRGRVRETRFLHYCLFVTFFPQLISGPIVHHREMIPQFDRRPRFDFSNFNVGLTFFVVGLFKKTVLADGIAAHSSPIFEAAALGGAPTFVEGWIAALGFTLQLYFDFSGYSDMAVGLARMFGIRLPFNFHSPLRAPNIIEFWRRWHMTLSRFLRDYLYFPLGGNRKGATRRHVNLFLTMLLGGLWHGASWTFVLWGGAHGLLLAANHGFRALKEAREVEQLLPVPLGRPLGAAATFLAVVGAFVLFRAESVPVTLEIFAGMVGYNGWAPVEAGQGSVAAGWVVGLLAIAWLFPNTQQLLRDNDPGLDVYGHLGRASAPVVAWSSGPIWAAGALSLLAASLFAMMIEGHAEFLYRFF